MSQSLLSRSSTQSCQNEIYMYIIYTLVSKLRNSNKKFWDFHTFSTHHSIPLNVNLLFNVIKVFCVFKNRKTVKQDWIFFIKLWEKFSNCSLFNLSINTTHLTGLTRMAKISYPFFSAIALHLLNIISISGFSLLMPLRTILNLFLRSLLFLFFSLKHPSEFQATKTKSEKNSVIQKWHGWCFTICRVSNEFKTKKFPQTVQLYWLWTNYSFWRNITQF